MQGAFNLQGKVDIEMKPFVGIYGFPVKII